MKGEGSVCSKEGWWCSAQLEHRPPLPFRFFVDLEMHLGEQVLMSQVGDIVLKHCPEFHALYVPYVTNMVYQEALLNQLL